MKEYWQDYVQPTIRARTDFAKLYARSKQLITPAAVRPPYSCFRRQLVSAGTPRSSEQRGLFIVRACCDEEGKQAEIRR